MQFITGHTWWKRHQSIISSAKGVATDPTCSLCEDGEETPIHLIHECGRVFLQSREIFGWPQFDEDHNDIEYTLDWSAKQIIQFIHSPHVGALFYNEETHEILNVNNDNEEEGEYQDDPDDPDRAASQRSERARAIDLVRNITTTSGGGDLISETNTEDGDLILIDRPP